MTIDETASRGTPPALLRNVDTRVRETDPDVLVVNTGGVVPALFETAAEYGQSVQLGRRSGYQQLAGQSAYESYGRVGHSPARYNVPGRVIIDESNTFFRDEAGLEGCLDLVERSGKPLQELG